MVPRATKTQAEQGCYCWVVALSTKRTEILTSFFSGNLASPHVSQGRLICAWFSRSRTIRGGCERGRLHFGDGRGSRFGRRMDADVCRGSAAVGFQPVSRTSSGQSVRDWSGAGATGSRVAGGSRRRESAEGAGSDSRRLRQARANTR